MINLLGYIGMLLVTLQGLTLLDTLIPLATSMIMVIGLTLLSIHSIYNRISLYIIVNSVSLFIWSINLYKGLQL